MFFLRPSLKFWSKKIIISFLSICNKTGNLSIFFANLVSVLILNIQINEYYKRQKWADIRKKYHQMHFKYFLFYITNWCIFAICETIKRDLTLTSVTRVYWTIKPRFTRCPISIKRLAFQQGSKLRVLPCFTFTQNCLYCVYFKWWFQKAETSVNIFSW